MQANLAKREPSFLAKWQGEDLYARVMSATAGATPYYFVDGPPYANGDIHIGHAVNKVLKDIVVKSARLNGHHAPFVPGWDCHGLPIELQVEKKFGKVGEKLDAAAFRAECRQYALEQIDRQRVDFQRLGILADWHKPYLTMQPAYEAEQLRVLARIADNGHVVRGFKPVHWCLDCGSSLAEAEVEYQDKQSAAIDVGFEAADPVALARLFNVEVEGPIRLVIWTTTPWTLPANQAIAVNADLDYALVRFANAGLLVLAAELVDDAARRYGDSASVLGTVKGLELRRHAIHARHPLKPATVPVISGEHVTLEAGTGLVHTAPAHGVDDYLVGKQNHLPVSSPLTSSGKFSDEEPVVGGLHVRKVDEPILAALRETGALVRHAVITHSYPHCWRHKTPLIFRATPQWFVSMEAAGLRAAALEAIDATRWIPAWGRERIRGMIADRPDWCISRQRTWGVPLALFVHKVTQEKHPRTGDLLRVVADKVQAEGLEAWFGSQVYDWLPHSEADDYDKCTDTLDVWFDSGSAHQCSFVSTNPGVLDEHGLAPLADMYLEGSDQHRGWFHSSLLTCVAMRQRSPYKAVLTHGFTVDEQGRKMSKSLGNVVAPQQVTKTLGADVLRLWVSASDYSGEIAISDNLLKRMADAYRRIRNTARYLLGNLDGFDPATDAVAPGEMLLIDRWAVSQAAQLQAEIRQAYADAQFHLVYQKLHNYCVTDLGGLYLDVLKDRLYTTAAKSLARRSAQTALLHIAEAMVRWITPVLSFTADEIWQLLPGDRSASVFAQRWYELPKLNLAEDGVDWPLLVATRVAVKKTLEDLRAAGTIGSGLNAEVSIYADTDLASALGAPGEELRFWFITSGARLAPLSAKPTDASEHELSSGEKIWVHANASQNARCERCWHQVADVGASAAYPGLCGRCVSNVHGAGEARRVI
ncbi:isoleucine--tRNA ligase [Hydrocarboniphaga sp.]|uniref:isoleucine--tRNA ligase n=1 Tax=Hydrocarboniphaga sp. TaxID=2033016 RepID=UPI003453C3B0